MLGSSCECLTGVVWHGCFRVLVGVVSKDGGICLRAKGGQFIIGDKLNEYFEVSVKKEEETVDAVLSSPKGVLLERTRAEKNVGDFVSSTHKLLDGYDIVKSTLRNID